MIAVRDNTKQKHLCPGSIIITIPIQHLSESTVHCPLPL
jgi:hypothetical protein